MRSVLKSGIKIHILTIKMSFLYTTSTYANPKIKFTVPVTGLQTEAIHI